MAVNSSGRTLVLAALMAQCNCMRKDERTNSVNANELQVWYNLSLEGKEPPAQCIDHRWKQTGGGAFAAGNHGQVFKVQKLNNELLGEVSDPEMFALKFPADPTEIPAMKAAAECPNTMTVTDDKPCVDDKVIKKGFVSKYMANGALHDWNDNNEDKKIACRKKIGNQILLALQCLHSADYIHGDVKADNFYTEQDPDSKSGCPNVYLGDFGESWPIGKLKEQHDSNQYCTAWHNPAGMFIDKVGRADKDKLGIANKQSQKFQAKQEIDYCAFVYLMDLEYEMFSTKDGKKYFFEADGKHPKIPEAVFKSLDGKDGYKGKCGVMGGTDRLKDRIKNC